MSRPARQSKRTQSKHLKGMQTAYEKALTPAYRKSNITDKSTRVPTGTSQRTFAAIQCEDDEFGCDDMFDSVFINAEEEKRIHALLQFARDEKITPANAFEVPVTVLAPQLTDANVRFWRFASQVLGASTCIYDKRMENFSLAVHQLFNSFVCFNCGQEEREPKESAYLKSRRKKYQLMRLEMAEMSQNANLSLEQIAMLNLQEVHKLNKKNSTSQFMVTPLFQRTLQSFDSNSLKSLFLNVFELTSQGELNFFRNKKQCKVEMEKIEMKESFDYEEQTIPQFVQAQLNKLDFIARNRQIYSHISQYLEQNSFKNDDYTNLIDLSLQIQHLKSKQSEIAYEGVDDDQRTQLSSNQMDRFSFHYISGFQRSPTSSNSQQSQISRCAVSEQCYKDFMIIEEQDWTVLNPRQLQFRGAKPPKKKKNASRSQVNKAEKKEREQQLIQFQQQQTRQLRNQIFKCSDNCLQTQDLPFQDKFLMPKSMDVFIEIHRKRRKQLRDTLTVQQVTSHVKQNLCQTEAPLSNRNDITVLGYPQEDASMSGSFRVQQEMSTEELNNLRTFGVRSIRQIKEQIQRKAQRGQTFKLSQLHLPISSASTFIVLLHLANENELTVHSIDEEKDVQVSRR